MLGTDDFFDKRHSGLKAIFLINGAFEALDKGGEWVNNKGYRGKPPKKFGFLEASLSTL